MVALEERLVTIESGGRGLHGVLHLPEDPAAGAFVFCHPFAEEKKCAHRTMVEAARAFAEAGWAALRFDLRGCGDSPGEFGECDLSGWGADLHSALDWLRGELSPRRAGLLGLRLGGALAARVAEERDDVDCLVLWEPIVDGERYIHENLRRSIIKAMMTRHEGGEDADGAAGQAHALGEGTVDFDGYQVPERMREQIAASNLLDQPRGFPGPVLVVNLSTSDSVAEPLRLLADCYPAGTAAAVRQEPVWQRIGVIDATPTTQLTVEWLQQMR